MVQGRCSADHCHYAEGKRKKSMSEKKLTRGISLNDTDAEYLTNLGDGNISEGARRLIRRVRDGN